MRGTGKRSWLSPWAALLLVGPGCAIGVLAAEHPSLVDPADADCAACHDDLISGRSNVHAVVEDCETCHEVTVEAGETTVESTDAEPPLCLMCHDELQEAVDGELDAPHYPLEDSCLNCHDPHAGDEDHLLAAPIEELCGNCHDPADLTDSHRGQLTPVTNCAGCHSPHGSNNPRMLNASRLHVPFEEGDCEACHRQPFGDRIRLRARGERLCEACHGELPDPRDEPASVHAALQGRRGRAGCLSCHDPHMSDQASLLIEADPGLCGRCHGEILQAAEAATGHAPAAEDCLGCHLPHASTERHLLGESPLELCAMCHDVEDDDLIKSHLGADLAKLDCVACHTPHGSGHPKLMARFLHEPVLDGCDMCHEGAADRLMEDGESALCLICHEEIAEIAEASPVPHGAMEMARCADCHNPHASAQEHLVKLPAGGVCVDCHEDQVANADEVAHGAIDLLGCRACHEPHGGSREFLLRESPPELCLACHEPGRVGIEPRRETVELFGRFEVPVATAQQMAGLRLTPDGRSGHPVPNHPVLRDAEPTQDKGKDPEPFATMSCSSCHDPHKGLSASLLLWGASSPRDACLHCHPK